MNSKRDKIPDSKIMDALDAAGYNITRAAGILGVLPNTLFRWVYTTPNLQKYYNMRLEADAVRARDVLSLIMDNADGFIGTPNMNGLITACKALLDKAEGDKLDINGSSEHTVNVELDEKVKKWIEGSE